MRSAETIAPLYIESINRLEMLIQFVFLLRLFLNATAATAIIVMAAVAAVA